MNGAGMQLTLKSKTEQHAETAQQLPAFAGINLRNIRNQISEALTNFGKFGLLDEYTKHDITHLDAMLAMYDWMIPATTRESMTPADWLLVTLSTYLHDFGLLVTRDEFDQRDSVAEFKTYRRRIIENDDPAVRDYSAQLELIDPNDADRFLYQEFARHYHAQRIRGWLQDTPDGSWGVDTRVAESVRKLLDGVEETFREDVGIVCESHHLDDLANLKKYPVNKPYGSTHDQEANVQYAAFLLRTSDLLHITSDRVPAMSALIINPRNPRSQVEWAKQRAVRSVRPLIIVSPEDDRNLVTPDTIEIHATFKEADGYFGLTNYLQYATRQLTDTFNISVENQRKGISNYIFPWRKIDTTNIEAKGFVAEPFRFTIDQAKILDLLTGHTLYNDTNVVVRELVQNSLDAVRLQEEIDGDSFSPQIDVTWDSTERVLSVLDNGTGMTQTVIEQNFLSVGSSHYQEPQFVKEFPDFASISRFGIGVLSTFMVADDVSVVTCHDSELQARHLSLRDVHGQYLVRLSDKTSEDVPTEIRAHGTLVRIKLRPSASLREIGDVLKHWIVIPRCRVTISTNGSAPEIVGYPDTSSALTQALLDGKVIKTDADGKLVSHGSPVEIRHVVDSEFEIAFAVSWNRWLQEWRFVNVNSRFPDDDRPALLTGIAVSGVRVTTDQPGFRHGGIASLVNISGKKARRTNVARSALEITDEYDNLLRLIYRAFFGHVSEEMAEFEISRQSSLTLAAQEGGYLTQDLMSGLPESRRLVYEEILSLPAIVIEESGVRRRISLEGLRSHVELASIESTMVESFESVLRSVRGVSSASLRNMLDATGAKDHELPAVLVCGLGSAGLLKTVFASQWEVVRFEAGVDSRQLEATWKPVHEQPRWFRYMNPPPPELQSILPANSALMRIAARYDVPRRFQGRHGGQNIFLCARPDEIEFIGFSESLASHIGDLYVLPDHPVLSVLKLNNADMPRSALYWCAGWLLGLILSDSSGDSVAYRELLDMPLNRLDPTSRQRKVLDVSRSAGLLDLVTEESLRAVVAAPALETLDVKLWDKRRE